MLLTLHPKDWAVMLSTKNNFITTSAGISPINDEDDAEMRKVRIRAILGSFLTDNEPVPISMCLAHINMYHYVPSVGETEIKDMLGNDMHRDNFRVVMQSETVMVQKINRITWELRTMVRDILTMAAERKITATVQQIEEISGFNEKYAHKLGMGRSRTYKGGMEKWLRQQDWIAVVGTTVVQVDERGDFLGIGGHVGPQAAAGSYVGIGSLQGTSWVVDVILQYIRHRTSEGIKVLIAKAEMELHWNMLRFRVNTGADLMGWLAEQGSKHFHVEYTPGATLAIGPVRSKEIQLVPTVVSTLQDYKCSIPGEKPNVKTVWLYDDAASWELPKGRKRLVEGRAEREFEWRKVGYEGAHTHTASRTERQTRRWATQLIQQAADKKSTKPCVTCRKS